MRDLVIGIGCRKGTEAENILQAASSLFESHGLELNRTALVATIELKRDEPGIFGFARQIGANVIVYTSQELVPFAEHLPQSKYALAVTGIGNVCQSAAWKAAGEDAICIAPKTIYKGITIAVYQIV